MNSENSVRKPNVFDTIDNSISNSHAIINELENSLGMICDVLGINLGQGCDDECRPEQVREAPQSKIHRIYENIGRMNERLSSVAKYAQSIRSKIDS